MIWWLFGVLVYLMMFTVTYRTAFTHYYEMPGRYIYSSGYEHNRETAVLRSTLLALGSPLVLPGMIFYRLATPDTERERAKRRELRDKQIAELNQKEREYIDKQIDALRNDFQRNRPDLHDRSGGAWEEVKRYRAEIEAKVDELKDRRRMYE